jgi:DNA-binding transcriptional regulator YiaG
VAKEPPTTSANADSTAADLAREIKQRRKDAGLSQSQLAVRAGYTHQYVSLAERSGQNLPSHDLVQVLDVALNAGGALLTLHKQAKAEQRARRRTVANGGANSVVAIMQLEKTPITHTDQFNLPQFQLPEVNATELAKLMGHLIDLELSCTIDINQDGYSKITYRYEVVNLTERPIKRMNREQWFEKTDGRIRITPYPANDRRVSIRRIHDTENMTKFACEFSPAIAPGEIADVGYVVQGGCFVHDHYWRQSTPRYTRHLTLTIRHRAAKMLVNCTAVVDHSDGSQVSVIDDLTCRFEDDDAIMTLTQNDLYPSESATIHWEIERYVHA